MPFIIVREYRRGNQKRIIRRHWQQMVQKMKQNKNTHNMCWTPLYANKNSVNGTCALLQTTGGKGEPSIVLNITYLECINILLNLYL